MLSSISPLVEPVCTVQAEAPCRRPFQTVEARPHRSMRDALLIAQRISRQPGAYLSACKLFDVPGVINERKAVAL